MRVANVLVLSLLWAGAVPAWGTVYYISPGGTAGSCGNVGGPYCSLTTGLANAQPGDELVLTNGTYNQQLRTVRSGTSSARITIRAQNKWQAIITSGSAPEVDISHDHITVRNLKVDGNRTGNSSTVELIGTTANPTINNITVEGCWIIDSGGTMTRLQDASNVIIRHNVLENSGYAQGNGSGFYLGKASVPLRPVTNVQIYGNTIRNTISNLVDMKNGVANVDVHHNIFEAHKLTSSRGFATPNDGLVRSDGHLQVNGGAGNFFRNNIVRNSASNTIIFLDNNRVDVDNNVFYVIQNINSLIGRTNPSGVIQITNNVFCNIQRDNRNETDHTWTGNLLNQVQARCDQEVNRITTEMAQLPGIGSGEPSKPLTITFAGATTTDTTHIAVTFTAPAEVTALSNCVAGSFSTTIGAGAPVAATGVTVNGLVATLTVQTMASGEVVRVSATAGACTNVTAFDNRAVTNTIQPVAVEFVEAVVVDNTTIDVTFNGASGANLSGCTAGSFSIRKNNGAAQAATVVSTTGLVATLTVPQLVYSDVVTISGTSGACTGPTSSVAFTNEPVNNTLTRPPDAILYSSATTVDSTHIDVQFSGATGQILQACSAPAFSITISGGSATDTPTTTVLEACGRTENPLANSTWANPFTGNHPGLQANGTACLGSSTSFSSSYWLGTVGPDSEAFFTLPDATGTTGNFLAAHIRSREPGSTVDGYRVKVLENAAGTDTVELNRLTNLGTTVLASTALEISDGHKIMIRGVGSTISAKHFNGTTWSEILSVTDTTYPEAGFIGVSANGNTLTFDDWGGGTTTGQTNGGGVATGVSVTGMTARLTVPTMAAGQTIAVTGIANACTNTPAFTAQPVTNTLGGSNAVLTATHHRCFHIDSAEGTRPHTPGDTNCAWIPGGKGRLEFQVVASSANLPATQLDVECDDDGAEAWYRVGAGAGRVTYAFDAGVSAAVPTARLVADCTFQATGLYYQLGQSPPLAPITLDNGTCTKVGASLQLNSGSVGQYSRCRLTGVTGTPARIDLVGAKGNR